MRRFTFQWPHHAEEVYVTGTFDNWTKSERLERVGQVFEKTVTIPESSDKIYYKFVVDGIWTTDHAAPQEKDHEGNENNVLLPEQMDKLEEEASQAAAINNLVPESTTAQLAGAVPLEEKKEVKQEDKKEEVEGASSDAAILSSAAPDSTTAQLAAAVPLEEKKEGEVASPDAAILSSAAPESTTAQLAAAVPLEEKKDNGSPPGAYPETPAADLDKEVKMISPLPAAEGAINPIKLAPGEEVPKDLTAGAIDTHVTLDEASYEQSDRIPGIDTTLPFVTGNMIPESSLPITGANDVAINTAAPEATTAALAGQVPLEPKVPEIVKQSQEEANVEPEASANTEEVKEKAAVEEELLEKVGEAPSTSEGTAGQGTEKSETDKTAVENVLAAATSAGEVALGAAITAGGAAAAAASKGADVAAEYAVKAGDVATDVAHKATIAASAAAHDAATHLPDNVKEVLPGAAEEAEAAAGKQKAAIDAVSSEVPAEVKESLKVAGASPEAAVNAAAVEEKKGYEAEILEKVHPAEAVAESSTKATEEEQKAATETVSAGVPIEVKESLQEAGASPEAAANTVAVDEKKETEAELLEKVKPAEAVGDAVSAAVPVEVKESLQDAGASPEAAANTAAVEEKKEAEAELLEKVKPAEAVGESSAAEAVSAAVPVEVKESLQDAGVSPEAASNTAAVEEKKEAEAELLKKVEPAGTVGEQTALAVEPPHPVAAVKTVDEAKPAETSKPAEVVKPAGDLKLTEDIAPAVTALSVEPPQPVEKVKAVDAAAPAESSLKASDEPKPAEAAPAVAGPTEVAESKGTTGTEASKPAVEHPATTGQDAPVEAAKADKVHPATNGTTTAPAPAPASSSIQSQTDKSTSEKKKKNRISGFFSKIKHKFT